MKTIRDAIHGDISLEDWEVRVVDTRPLQRLRGIKQLGTSYLVYPSAVHTRFEHSLGTCWLTKRILSTLRDAGSRIDPELERVAQLTALLHDITHVPFGHTFEDERRLMDRHDEDVDRLGYFLDQPPLAKALMETGVAPLAREVLSRRGTVPLLRELVAGTVCADLLDYLKRDSRFCGLSLDYDDRLYHYFAIRDGRLAVRLHKSGLFRRDALSELVHLLQIRYSLTERVYYHHAKVVAGAMISRALELALDAGQFAVADLYELRDDSFLDRLSQRRTPENHIGDLLDDLADRRLYKRVYMLTLEGLGRPGLTGAEQESLCRRFHFDVLQRRRLEQQLADALRVPEAHVIVYCPSPTMSLKEADVPVEIGDGRIVPLSHLEHPDVRALTEKHRGLWRFYVCLRRGHDGLYDNAGKWCQEAFGHANQLEPLRSGQLHWA